MGHWHTNGSPNLGQTTIPYDNQQKKRTCRIVDFAVLANHRIKVKECEKKDMYLDIAWELKKTMEHEGDNYTNHDWRFWYSHQNINKGTGELRNKRTSSDHPTYHIIENGQNTEKNPCYHSYSSERPSGKTDGKTLKEKIMIAIIINGYHLYNYIIENGQNTE